MIMINESLTNQLVRLMHERVNESVYKGIEVLQRNGELILTPGDLTLVENPHDGRLDIMTEVKVELRDREIINSLRDTIAKLEEENKVFKRIIASYRQHELYPNDC